MEFDHTKCDDICDNCLANLSLVSEHICRTHCPEAAISALIGNALYVAKRFGINPEELRTVVDFYIKASAENDAAEKAGLS
jgi:hypothetical protein